MSEWTFKNGISNKLVDADPRWISAIETALQSKATPLQSGYHVNTGAITKNGNIVIGSNHEMAITDTITHGEEAVIAAALEKYGMDDKIQVIAFAGLGGGEIPASCGNCRDALKQYTDVENLIMINAPKEGGEAVFVPGKVFFKDDFTKLSESPFQEYKEILHAQLADFMAYDIYSKKPNPNMYGAAIVCEDGDVFRGSFRGNVSYHPVLPISAAIGNLRDSRDYSKRFKVKCIVVASENHIPNVLYKDRQDALEFAEAMQALNGKKGKSLDVYLVSYSITKEYSHKIFHTDTNEWLPHAFSPSRLGLEDKMVEAYRNIL
ncbi:TPA: hypothetical protein HA235_04985 [Candidatus Woesearchaeota archaeon]|nr:hypothetical protein [Candidatus Woesearchaeota archaeon]HIH54979.1 hypothetical protein [Candidatus Woesearchaeota archaeon]HIJ01636.1 hypothetical protein [Candidatus Woesearchaeota archaeon]HIJ13371.1 hypothetical protein [Candidatus Woesearchaeota archaeon]